MTAIAALDLHRHALTLVDQQRFDDALTAWMVLAGQRPKIAVIQLHIAQCCEALGLYHAAKTAYRRSTQLYTADPKQPDAARAWFGLGSCLFRLGKPDDAIEAWETGLRHDCESPRAIFQRSQVKLAMGDYEGGWVDYEARKQLSGYKASLTARGVPDELPPEWDGESAGRVLVIGTQGAGDVIQFSRYLPEVEEWSQSTPRLICGDPLAPWLGYQGSGPCEYSVAIDSLPLLRGMYNPEPPDFPKWMKPDHSRPLVGVCWKGSPHHLNDRDRSSPISFLEAFADTRWSLVSLQQGEGAYFPHYAATAAAIAKLDCVVTCDSSVVHVAGTLGVPTVLIPPSSPEYRWGIKGETTPWYPSVRIVRRQKHDDWPGAIARAKKLLQEML